MTWLQAASARVVARWTRLYTAGLPAPIRDRRREEIGADAHGQLDEARSRRERPAMTAFGSPPGSVLPAAIDMASAPAPFIIVFDSQHRVLASSGHLNGRTPGLPAGVLAWVTSHGQDRITWQPGPGLREAAVIEPYGGLHPGFVLAAQSLQGISGQQRSLTWSIAYFWLAAFAISFLIARLFPARTTTPRPPSLSEFSG